MSIDKMRLDRIRRKDAIGAVLLLVLGGFVIVQGLDFRLGSLNRMGAGFVPVVIGVLLVFVGGLLGVATLFSRAEAEASTTTTRTGAKLADTGRAWLCIVGGVVAFVVLGRFGGLVPASFVAVFVAALGDRAGTWRSSLVLATVLTLFCVAVFHAGLHLQLPLFQWG